MTRVSRIALVSACVAFAQGCIDDDPGAGDFSPFTAGAGGAAGRPSINVPNGVPPDTEMPTFCLGECDPRGTMGCEPEEFCDVQSGRAVCLAEYDSEAGDEGDPCDSSLDCLPGLGCFEQEEAAGGICQAFCCGLVSSECAPGLRCEVRPTVDGDQGNWGRCVETTECDLLLAPQDTCAEGEGCYVVSRDGATDCMTAGVLPVGADCEFVGDCEPGSLCTGRVEPKCVPLCNLEGFDICAEGERCLGYAHTQPSGAGLCTSVDANP